VYAYLAAPERIQLLSSAGGAEAHVTASLRVNNAEAMRAAAVAGLGVAQLPVWCAAGELARGALRVVLPDWSLPANRVQMVYASARYVPTRVQRFMDFLAAELKLPTW